MEQLKLQPNLSLYLFPDLFFRRVALMWIYYTRYEGKTDVRVNVVTFADIV